MSVEKDYQWHEPLAPAERSAQANGYDRGVAAERERCAKIAESIGQETGDGEGEYYIARKIAAAIRQPST